MSESYYTLAGVTLAVWAMAGLIGFVVYFLSKSSAGSVKQPAGEPESEKKESQPVECQHCEHGEFGIECNTSFVTPETMRTFHEMDFIDIIFPPDDKKKPKKTPKAKPKKKASKSKPLAKKPKKASAKASAKPKSSKKTVTNKKVKK